MYIFTNRNWEIRFHNYVPDQERIRETLLTLGNGFFATRGTLEEIAENTDSYPGVYISGAYNSTPFIVQGEKQLLEQIVNWPNWLPLRFRPVESNTDNRYPGNIISNYLSLHMEAGFLKRYIRYEDDLGRITDLHSIRFVHMAHQHIGGLVWVLTPVNWSGKICIRSLIDGTVTNSGEKSYLKLSGKNVTDIQLRHSGWQWYLFVR